jgi:hypothetical protein
MLEHETPQDITWVQEVEEDSRCEMFTESGDKQCFCKSDIHKKRFCNNCGAKMVEPQESEKI